MEENRIKSIEAYGKRRKDEAIKKELAEKNEKEILLAKICNKAEVITSLIDTANACVRNGIHLGKFVGSLKHPQFVTDGIDHHLGFVISDNYYPECYKNPHPMMGGGDLLPP